MISYRSNAPSPPTAVAPRVRDYIVIEGGSKRPTIAAIQACVARYFRIPVLEMTSERRSREVARPRQVAMYLSKQLTPLSLPEIGRRFGGRDHTTVIHAVRRITASRETDHALDAAIKELETVL